ncbi:ATPase with role in protein import into the ER [Dissophora globulifera]|uniref:ATPase with role in protein import into the ER n=1 Tax=Dissophora globulifera TaxID=979702 RepID=A0A9P6UN80_9FUNG|nr:ATPase with role in protein import into the ER [Dissophora globulifera]
MKGSSKLFTVLVALIVLTFLTSVAVSNPPRGVVLTTLAIDVGSSAARLSVLVGVNGLAFGDTGEPRIILTGPGTHSSPEPLESNWTAEGFLLIKDGTDEAQYVHPSNTLFNLDHPIELRSRGVHNYHNRPHITGYQAFTLLDITGISTFEVSVHKVGGGTSVTASSVYDQHLGGNDFNRRVVHHLLLVHKNKTGQDLSGNDMFLLRLGSEVEKAKQVLSVQDWVQIEIECLQSGSQGLSEVLTRSQFEDLNMDLFTKTITAIDQAIKNSFVYTKDDIQDIVFSGGSANIPFLQSTIKEYFGLHKKYHGSSHPETTIVLGAAKLGHWYQDTRHFTGGVLCSPDAFERTVTLGIETAGGAMFKYTDRYSYLAVNKMYTFTTTKDYQDQVVIRVYSGKGKFTSQNRFLGKLRLTGIALAPKGTPQIRVWLRTYECTEFINLNVMDVASGRTNATIISMVYYGKKFDDEIGAFELEPAGKLALLH